MLFHIEGNLGSGKTTIINRLKNCRIISEPLEKWRSMKDSTGSNALDYYYKHHNGFPFQVLATITKFTKMEKTQSKFPIVTERSIHTDNNVFAPICRKYQYMDEMQHKIYSELYNSLTPSRAYTFIYVKSTPEVCYKRIKKRNRPEEKNITLKYLQDIHDMHEKWLFKKHFTINGDIEFDKIDIIITQINHYIDGLHL